MEEKEVLEIEEDILENRDYAEEILAVIRNSKTAEEITIGLSNYHDNDIAAVLEFLTKEERIYLYSVLGDEAVSNIFSYLDDVEIYIEELSNDKAADVIEEMDADDAVDVLEELDDDKRQEILELIEPEAKENIELIDSYEEDVFGSVMTTNFIVINKDSTIKKAMRSLINQAAVNDNISKLYVVDENGCFYGAVDLKDLIVARQTDNFADLITSSYPFVYDTENINESIDVLREYSENSIPVISEKTKEVLGVITAQDIIEMVDEQLGEDYVKFAGLTEEEELFEPLSKSVKKRIPWLIILLFLGLGISSVIGAFENVVKELSVIVCFQSLILGMAGNTGTQSLAVTIRILAGEELTLKERISLIFREIKIAFANGFLLSIISFAVTFGYLLAFKGEATMFSLTAAGCVALSLLCTMIIAGFSGTGIPLVLKRIGLDPAVASGPLITTINDFVSVIVYYSLAWTLLSNMV